MSERYFTPDEIYEGQVRVAHGLGYVPDVTPVVPYGELPPTMAQAFEAEAEEINIEVLNPPYELGDN